MELPLSDLGDTLGLTTMKRPRTDSDAMSHASLNDQSTATTLPLTKDVLQEFDRTNSYISQPEDYWTRHLSLLSDPPDFSRISAFAGEQAFEMSESHEIPRAASIRSSQNPGQSSVISSRPSTAQGSAPSTKAKCGPGHSGFVARLKALGITDDNLDEDKITPQNLSEIRDALRKPRPEFGSSELGDDIRKAFAKQSGGLLESHLMISCFHLINGNESHNHPSDDKPLDALKPFDEDLQPPKPSIHYGSNIADVNTRVMADLEIYIAPRTHVNGIIAPNFFFEMRPPDVSSLVARRQAMYDSAAGARGIYRLQNYRRADPILDGNAYTLAATFSDGMLKFFCMHPKASTQEVGRIDYDMLLVDAYSMVDIKGKGHENFIKAATAYRNARDWAKEQRERFISEANLRAADPIALALPIYAGHVTPPRGFHGRALDISSDELSRAEPRLKRRNIVTRLVGKQ